MTVTAQSIQHYVQGGSGNKEIFLLRVTGSTVDQNGETVQLVTLTPVAQELSLAMKIADQAQKQT